VERALVTRQMGRGGVKHGVARGVVRCCGMKGAFYWLGEAVEGRGGGRRRWIFNPRQF
jgi:hypothetical protein